MTLPGNDLSCKRVLIVDDDALCSRALARDFTAIGCAVKIAKTYSEAVDAVSVDLPDLVVLDFYLKNRSALELLTLWRQSLPSLDIILVSGNPSLSLAVDAMRQGAAGFCTKPVTVDRIFDELQQRKRASVTGLQPIGLERRLCSQTLHADGVDRFFAISQGLLCVAGFDGYFKMLNRAWEQTLGYTLDELCAKPHIELVHPEDREKASDEAVQICGGEPIFYFRNRYRCKNGSYKWLAWNASPAPTHQLIYASASDITKAVAVEEKLSATATRLRRLAEKREELLDETAATNTMLVELGRFKDEMSGLVVHDLKNPLSVIVSNYDFIVERVAASPECMEALVDSRNAGRRMMRLLANLLDVTRLEENRLEVHLLSTNISRLFGDILDQRRVIGQSLQLTLKAEALTDEMLEVDADLLARTAENIIDNALRYTPAGGRIEVELRDAGTNIEARIGNTGEAVPEDARTIIFDKHHQMSHHAAHMNLGLGLYFCRLATEAQGGKIWVEETETLPTVFALQFPRHREALAEELVS